MDGAGGNQADVEISEADGNQTAPSEEHVAFIEKAETPPGGVARTPEGVAGKAIEPAAREMTKRVARESVQGQENDISEKNQRTNPDPETVVEKEGYDSVMPEK